MVHCVINISLSHLLELVVDEFLAQPLLLVVIRMGRHLVEQLGNDLAYLVGLASRVMMGSNDDGCNDGSLAH